MFWFSWCCIENDHNFERNEDCVTFFLKWTDFSKKWDFFWKLLLLEKKVFFTSYILELLIFIFFPSFTCSIYISMSYSPILYMKYITKVVPIRKYVYHFCVVLPYFDSIYSNLVQFLGEINDQTDQCKLTKIGLSFRK